jgi:hypothetical protein
VWPYRLDKLRADFEAQSIELPDPEADVGATKRDLLDEASEARVA